MTDYESKWRMTSQENQQLRDMVDRLRGNKRENPTLRDQFAMIALPAVIEMSSLAYNNSQFDYLAKKAYLIADEMMKAREK
jgi:hypothetical protein